MRGETMRGKTMRGETRTFRGKDGISLYADVYGDPGQPPVVFLHGGGQTRHAWGDAAERFAAEGYYTVTLDLRGHGDSEWAADADYHMSAFSADLLAVIDQLPGTALPALVGASLGGVTSLLTVGNANPPVARLLVLVDIVPKMNHEGALHIQRFMTANPDGFASVEEAADAVAAYLPHRPRPKDVSGLNKNLRLRNGRYYWHWDPKFLTAGGELDPLQAQMEMEAAARNIHIPTLLVRGGLSELVDDAGVEAFREVLPNAEVVDVAGAGHMVAGDMNTPFDEAVLAFLRRHDH